MGRAEALRSAPHYSVLGCLRANQQKPTSLSLRFVRRTTADDLVTDFTSSCLRLAGTSADGQWFGVITKVSSTRREKQVQHQPKSGVNEPWTPSPPRGSHPAGGHVAGSPQGHEHRWVRAALLCLASKTLNAEAAFYEAQIMSFVVVLLRASPRRPHPLQPRVQVKISWQRKTSPSGQPLLVLHTQVYVDSCTDFTSP